MTIQDKTLHCRSCDKDFVFTTSEQELYTQKGLAHEPTHCPTCRIARRNSARGISNHREMHSITCDECGKEAMVPFIPQLNKPVYCSFCFEKVRTKAPANVEA